MIQKFLLLFLSVTLQSDKGLEGDLLRPSNYVLLSKDIFVQLIYRRKNAKSSVLSNFNRISFQYVSIKFVIGQFNFFPYFRKMKMNW